MREDNLLTVVIPCYNEEEVLPETIKELSQIMTKLISSNQINSQSKLLFVDDGSKDKTWSLIQKYSKDNELVTGIKFSRNYGHQNALLAGMTTAIPS